MCKFLLPQVPHDDMMPVVSVPRAFTEAPEAMTARKALLVRSLNHLCDRAVDYIERQEPQKLPEEPRSIPYVYVLLVASVAIALLAVLWAIVLNGES